MYQTLVLLVPAKRRLTNAALERISSILAESAQISLGTVVIPALVDKSNPLLIGWGLVVTIVFWIISISIAQKIL
ncbi:hypothetical protein HZB78_00340 [Candidatus Collierbacteria bacterium]|nr:hypothetical protein [Candidatus Collierbacteria bacterium]